jgi:ubiquinone biosynthesis protein UbiJ
MAGRSGLPPGLPERLASQGVAAVVAALDHLLAQNDWARARLAGHAGRRVLVGVETFGPQVVLAIIADGRVAAADADGPAPAVSMMLRPSAGAFLDMLRDGATGLARHLRIEGDAALAADLGELARHLRWDLAEDLSRFTGDIAAQRIVAAVSGLGATLRDAGGRVESQFAQYLSVESGRLVDRDSLLRLSDRLTALEQRIDGLSVAPQMAAPRVAAPRKS